MSIQKNCRKKLKLEFVSKDGGIFSKQPYSSLSICLSLLECKLKSLTFLTKMVSAVVLALPVSMEDFNKCQLLSVEFLLIGPTELCKIFI